MALVVISRTMRRLPLVLIVAAMMVASSAFG